MAIELPGWLVTAFYVIGLPWPGVDEDQLRAWAQSVRAFADDATISSARTHQAIAELAASSQSSSIGRLAGHWDQRNQLVADLHSPMHGFADALEVAADAVVVQKDIVIVAATVLAEEFIVTQADAFFSFGLSEAALPAEIFSAREIVDGALQFLEAELIGKLIGVAVEDIAGHLSHFLGEFLGVALPVAGEVAGLTMAYGTVRDAAQQARAQAADIEETGHVAYVENASRDLRDSSAGDDAGGRWAEVVQALEQGLGYIAQVLFKGLSRAISEIQEATAAGLDRFANAIEDTDEGLGHDAQLLGVTDDVKVRVGGGPKSEEEYRYVDLAAARQNWKTEAPRLRQELAGKLAEFDRDRPAPPNVSLTELSDFERFRVGQEWELVRPQVHQLEAEVVTPALRRIEAEDPQLQLIGLDRRLKADERVLEKAAKVYNEAIDLDLTPEDAVRTMNDTFRYTYQISEEHYTDSVTAAMRDLEDAGFKRVRFRNLWDEEYVKGINSAWEVPGTGRRFEVQFHTPISFEATRMTHAAYERLRLRMPDGISPEERDARDADNAWLDGFQSRVNQHVPVPAGAPEIKDR